MTAEQDEALHWLGFHIEFQPGEWNKEHCLKILQETVKDAKLKNMKPLYALFNNGRETGLPLPDVMEILGLNGVREKLIELETTKKIA